ncbi:MAG: hypothetical protein AB8H80_04735 [Planctomycetota bacterium]
MALEHPRLLAASLTVALFGTACSTPIDASFEADGSSTTSSGAPLTAGGDSSSPESLLDAAAAAAVQDPQGSVREERKRLLVKNWLDNARKLRERGELQAAKMELLRAKDLSPTNTDVQVQLAAVQAELGEAPGTAASWANEVQRLERVNQERSRALVMSQLQTAEQNMANKDYAGALEELRRARLAIDIKQDIDWMTLPQQVESLRAEADSLYDQQTRDSQAAENAELAAQLRRDYERQQTQRRARVDGLIRESQVAFEAKQFERSQDFAARALEFDPSNTLAYEMQNMARKAARDTANEEYWRVRAIEIRKMLEADAELKVPQTDVLVMDAETWARANSRKTSRIGQQQLSPQDAAVSEQVETVGVGRLTYTEETGAYLDVFKNLSLLTGVQIITTPEARTIIDDESLTVVIELAASMTLKDFLNHMISRSEGLAWTIKDGVIVVGDKSQAAGTLITDVYPVKDLIFKQTMFLPPTIRDIPTEDAGDIPRTGGEGDDPIDGIELGDLVTTLQESTDSEYWGTEGVEIRAEDSGLLTVTASPEMHDKLLKLLRSMRRYQTPIVTIDSKFLTISRNFLQEVGIDIRGLGGSGNSGDTVSLDDVTNGLINNASRGQDNGGTGDPAANPLAGAFFNDGGDGDIRARTENYFVNDLGRVLSPTGGLTAGWTLIDDTQLNLILRAVEKRQNAEIVNSQILSVVDRGRGHVAVINQTAYIRDFDVEVAQAAFIADPKVDVIQDGIVLDVQPVIMNDRKYITLNLNPTVAELQRPIPTFTTSLAGSTLPVTVQLPNLTVTNFSTTVRVPDGGTVLLGGLRQVLTKERRAEVPLLARLPLISFLFKQEGSVDENRSLMVMVRAQVTDVVDQQADGAAGGF